MGEVCDGTFVGALPIWPSFAAYVRKSVNTIMVIAFIEVVNYMYVYTANMKS